MSCAKEQETRRAGELPLLSIIIVTLNRAKYIERCLLSVFTEIESDYSNAEVVVIDGGSSDGTLAIIDKYKSRFGYWVSEPDSGVSEAVNKGIKASKGELIRFLGADDEIVPGSTSTLVDYLFRDNLDVLIGHADFYTMDESGRTSKANIKQPIGKLGRRDFLNIGRIGWPSPEVALYRRETFEQHGGYSTEFHYLAYLELWLRFTKAGVTFRAIPDLAAKRYLTPDSDTVKGAPDTIQAEMLRVLKAHGDLRWWARYCVRQAANPGLNLARNVCHSLGVHPMRTFRTTASRLTESRSR